MDKCNRAARFLALLAAVLMLAVLAPAAALAADAYDPDQETSITIQLADIGSNMQGATFRCYKVGEFAAGPQPKWQLVSELAHLTVDLNDLKTASDVQQAARLLQKEAESKLTHSAEAVSDAKGQVAFTGLEHGMYLIVQTKTAQYGRCEPFLVGVPYTDENGLWSYQMKVEAKAEPLSTPTPTPAPTEEPESTPTPSPTATPVPGWLPQTGDGNNLLVWVVLICVACAGLVATLVIRNRKK